MELTDDDQGMAQAVPANYPMGVVAIMADSQNGSLSPAELALQSIARQQDVLERRKQVISSTGHALEYVRDAHENADSASEKREFAKAIKILEDRISSTSASVIDFTTPARREKNSESNAAVEGVTAPPPNGVVGRRPRSRIVELPPPPPVEATSEPVKKPKKPDHIAVSGQHSAVIKRLFVGKALPKSIEELCEAYGENWREVKKFSIRDKDGQKTLPLGEIIGTPYEIQFCKGLVTSFEEIAKYGRGEYDAAIAAGELILERHVADIWKTKIRQPATVRRFLVKMGCYPPKVEDPA